MRTAQARAVYGTRGQGVDANFGAEVARQDLGQNALAGLGHGVVGAVGVGHGDVFLATEVTRHVEHDAVAARFHARRVLADQRVVGDQIGRQGAIPGLQAHVHDHLFGAGDPGVVDQEIDVTEQRQAVLV